MMRDLLQPFMMAAAFCAALLGLAACGRPASPPQPLSNTTDPQWVHRQEPPAKVALVFIHGIFGDTLGTWKSSGGTSFFDLVEGDGDLGPQVDILAFGYTSRMIGTGSFDIQEAANRLHLYLDNKGVLDYPAVVFVAHSMGGLVVLRELLTHRELLDRVPLILFYATPQEGAQITTIARKVASNPALEQMLPADRNGYLRVLNDEWQALGAGKRPPILCAYEKQPTYGVMVVPWSSATRFCDEPALAIDADHLSIVKPDRPGHDSMVFLATKLKQYVLGRQLVAKLETPDFAVEDDHALLTISDPAGKREARLVNAGGSKLRYTLEQFPDRWLYVIPGAGPDEIPANATRTLQFVLGYGAKEGEYRFLLTSDAAPSRKVVVRIQNLPAIQTAWNETALAVSRDLTGALSGKELEHLKAAGVEDAEAHQRLAGIVKDSIAKRYPQLPPSGQWLLSADLLNSINWPHLAVRALQNAERADQAIAQAPSARRLASVSASLAGEPEVFANVKVQRLDVNVARAEAGANPFTAARTMSSAAQLASRLQQVPSLAAQGFSLEGDLKSKRGDEEGALAAYGKAGAIQMSPSISLRTREVEQSRVPAHEDSGAQQPPRSRLDPSVKRIPKDSKALDFRRATPELELEKEAVRPP